MKKIMKCQAYVDRILLLLIACLYLADHGVGTNSVAAAPSIACSKDHPGHIKCRSIEADCYHSSTTRRDYECVCSKDYWMLDGKCRKSDWCAEGEIGDMDCKSNGTTCKVLQWTIEIHKNLPYKCECESRVAQFGICTETDLYCRQRGASSSYRHQNITVCECDRNSFFDYNRTKCQNLDLCPFIECKGKYEECQGSKCVCQIAYEKIGNECRPRNYCLTNNVCGSAKCEEGPPDDPKRIRCYCDSGYVLDRNSGVQYCKLVRCETQSMNPCDHICTYSAGRKSSSCACLPGHTLKSDGITCEIQASHKCAYNICRSKSICVKLNDTEECMCKNSLVGNGDSCIDRCAARLLRGVCPGECNSTEDGFQCICNGKYRLSKNQVTCEERQMCVKGEHGFLTCRGQNRSCIDSPQTEAGFTCGACLPGLQEFGWNCTDPCEVYENRRYCEDKGATCVSVTEDVATASCRCPPLFTWDIKLGCIFARHSYTGELRIFNSYTTGSLNGTLRYGEDDFDWKKMDHDIGKSMSALYGKALSKVNVVLCRSDQKDENHKISVVCMIELQLHFKDYGILQRINARSICRGSSIVFCFIPPYLKLVPRQKTMLNVDVPFYRSDVCGLFYGSSICPSTTDCVRDHVGFACVCKKGLIARSTLFLNNDKTGLIEICQDENECETVDPCPEGTSCINTIGDFECHCKPGFFRKHDSGDPKVDICTEPCEQVNCIHGRCEWYLLGFYCRCYPGYTGVYCGETIPGHNSSTTGGGAGRTVILAVGIVEAIIFVVFIILCVVFGKCTMDGIKEVYERNRTMSNNKRNGAPRVANARNRTIDHIHMRDNPEGSERVRPSPQEDPDEPIYADCAQGKF